MAFYDCFTFFNEYELLELRLKALYNVVDYFVICELDRTQNGQKKPYNFEKEINRYKPYLDKIIYLKETNAPKISNFKKGNNKNKVTVGAWDIEHYQRNCIIHALNKCRPDDLILISDLDEIPNPEILKTLRTQ